MTNGEMIQKVFNCEVCEPIIEDDIIHVIFADKKDSAIGLDWSWWNAEYKEPSGDAVSRQWLMRKATEMFYTTNYFNHITKMIEEAPSVKPQEPKTGHWVDGKCDKCGNHAPYLAIAASTYFINYTDYCPNCGCYMFEPQEVRDKK